MSAKQPIDNMYDFLDYLEETERAHSPSYLARLKAWITSLSVNNSLQYYHEWMKDSLNNNQLYGVLGRKIFEEKPLDKNTLGKVFEENFFSSPSIDNEQKLYTSNIRGPNVSITPELYVRLSAGEILDSDFYFKKFTNIYASYAVENPLSRYFKNMPFGGKYFQPTNSLETVSEVLSSRTARNGYLAAAIGIAVAATVLTLPALLVGFVLAAKVTVLAAAATVSVAAVGAAGFFAGKKINQCIGERKPVEFEYGQ